MECNDLKFNQSKTDIVLISSKFSTGSSLNYFNIGNERISLSDKTIVNRGGLVLKLGKLQRSKQRCQDLGWKVHDRAQSFVLRSYTMHKLRNQHVSIC